MLFCYSPIRSSSCAEPSLVLALSASATLTHAETVTFDFPDSGNDSIRTATVTSGGLSATIYSRVPSGVFQISGPYLYPGEDISIGFSQDLTSLSFAYQVIEASQGQSLDLREDGALVEHIGFSAYPPGFSGTAIGNLTVTGRFDSVDFDYFSNVEFLRDITATTASDGTTVTPEPTSLALLGTGALGAVGLLRRRLQRHPQP